MTITHAKRTAKDNSEMHDVSASAWNDDHVVTGLVATGDLDPAADDTYDIGENATPLEWKDIYIDGVGYFDAIQMHGDIEILDTLSIKTGNSDLDYIVFEARDTGVGVIEVARMQGGGDPYFSMGGAQQFKFWNSGTADFGSVVVTGTNRIYFFDTGVYVTSNDDGHLDLVADVSIDLNAKVSRGVQTSTLGVGATTLALTEDTVVLTGNGGGNNLATITGGVIGQRLIILCTDANVTFINDDGHGANTIDLVGAGNLAGADDTTLTLVSDGTSWYETSRSVN